MATKTTPNTLTEITTVSDMFKIRGRLPGVGLLLLFGLLTAGCASDAELDTLDPQSEVAETIWNLAYPVFILAGVVLVLICGAVLYLAFKHGVRTYEDDDEFPEQISHNNSLEIAWTIVPALIMAAIGVFTIITHIDINGTDDNSITIDVAGESVEWEPTIVVVGQQWWWEYRYYLDGSQIKTADLGDPRDLPPADIVTSGQFAFPAGTEVELIITSRDVIHSHKIPALNGTKDAVPGRYTPWKIEANDPGVYFGQCSEFCGLSHSRMRMQAVAMTDDDFQAWIDMQMSDATFDESLEGYVDAYRETGVGSVDDADNEVLRGLDVFTTQCASCHLVGGLNDLVNGEAYDGADTLAGSAPNLTHLANNTMFAGGLFNLYNNEDGTLNRDDLAAWIRDPDAVKSNRADDLPDGVLPMGMPDRNLSERQINDVIAFLETLGPRPTDERIAATEVE